MLQSTLVPSTAEHLDPMNLRVAGLVVLCYAPVNTPSAPDATGKIQSVSEQDTLWGRVSFTLTGFLYRALYSFSSLERIFWRSDC